MKRRRLNDDDLDLWRRVTDRTEKLDLKSLFTPDIDAPAPAAPALRRAKLAVQGKPQGKAKPRANSLIPSVSDQVRQAPVQMDKKAFTKLKRGKLSPEGRIDLHGMTLDRAHPALTGFVMNAHAQGKRLILVVTGKGKQRDEGGPIPVRHGVLRHQVPQWLTMQPMKSVVLQVAQAHLSHGGGGAYYVYLRRRR